MKSGKLLSYLALSVLLPIMGIPASPSYAQDCTTSLLESGIRYEATQNNDVICLFGNNIIVNTLGGDDLVLDYGENNTIFLGAGDDTYLGQEAFESEVSGGEDDDEITGTPGDDQLQGNEGNDQITSALGDDFLNGGNDSDSLSGGAGDDIIIGGDAIDALYPGAGWNICDYNLGENVDLACKYDDTPPNIQDLSITPQQVDVSESDAEVELRFKVEDESGIPTYSDVNNSREFLSARIMCSPDIADYEAPWIEIYLETKDKLEDGSFLVRHAIPKGSTPGVYRCFFQATDNALNETPLKVKSVPSSKRVPIRWVYPTDDSGVSLVISRSGSNWFDQAPLLSNFQANAESFDSSVDRLFTIHANVTGFDPQGGTAFAYVRCLNPENSRQLIQSSEIKITSDGAVNLEMSIHENAAPGDYQCWWYSTQDHRIYLNLAGVAKRRAYSPTGLTITLSRSNPGPFDDDPPALVYLRSDKTVIDSSEGDSEITFNIKVTDKTNVNYFYFHCARLVVGAEDYQTWGFGSYLNFSQKSIATAQLKVPFGTKPGRYHCFYSTGDKYFNNLIDSKYIDSVGEVDSGYYFTVVRPGKVKPTIVSDTTARIDWLSPATERVDSVLSFQVEISKDNVNWKQLLNSSSKTLGVNLSGLKAVTKYFVRVTAIYFSGLKTEIKGQFTTKSPRPGAPTALGIGKKSGKIQLTWKPSSGKITNYKVYYSQDLQTWTLVNKPTSVSTTLALSGLKSKSTYYFKVIALNSTGPSADSKVLKVVTN